MTVNLDNVSALLKRCLDILLLKHPERTVYGVIIGFALHGVGTIWQATNDGAKAAMNALSDWHFICAGIITINLPNILFFSRTRTKFPESVEQALAAIDQMKEMGYSESEIKLRYNQVLNELIKSMSDEVPTSLLKEEMSPGFEEA